MRLFDRPRISNNLLADLKIHQRLTAKEIHLEVVAVAGVFDEKIDGSLAGLDVHEALAALEFALRGKAVGAVQIACVRHEQAQCLYDGSALLEVTCGILVDVVRKELAPLFEFGDVFECVVDVGFRSGRVVCLECGSDLGKAHSGIEHCYCIVCHVIWHVNAGAVGVDDYIVTVHFVLMNHVNLLSLCGFAVAYRA